ncbi:hypothetical protein [Robbsia andropogonis]|uniref:hypothetical protein n=1 Tax=Robbsia andropogonis TaxID=28092 RepID=UPI000465CC5A|nr:hypothetical protein [Robbsia andropogonis]MCP1120497.1 hypothetical protein [Robbsia andropogonis]MCP1131278.1 hypothetical protein [Robbsia andropogonis]
MPTKPTTQPTADIAARAYREIDTALEQCERILAVFEVLQITNRKSVAGINADAITDIGRDIAGQLVEHLGRQLQQFEVAQHG